MATINKNFKVKNGLDVSGNTTVQGTITATTFIGDGSGLTGVGGGVTSYNNLTDKPTLFSGSYNDLSDKPNSAASIPTVVNAEYTLPEQRLTNPGQLVSTPLTLTVTPSSTSSPVFVTFNFQVCALDGQGDAGLELQLYRDNNEVQNSKATYFLADNGALTYAQFPVTYTFAFVPGVVTPIVLTIYAKNTGGNGVVIGTPLQARFRATAIVW